MLTSELAANLIAEHSSDLECLAGSQRPAANH